ncbi:hypothetical protein D3C75_1359870 [compost metagenome]
MDQLLHMGGLFPDQQQELPLFILAPDMFVRQQHIRITGDIRQRGLQIMGYAGRPVLPLLLELPSLALVVL